MKIYFLSQLFMLSLILIASCKKDDINSSACRINTVVRSFSYDSVNFFPERRDKLNYNSDGKIASVIFQNYSGGGTSCNVFKYYSDDSISVIYKNGIPDYGQIKSHYLIRLNSYGRIEKVEYRGETNSGVISTNYYEYDSENYLSKVRYINDFFNYNDSTLYFYTNGNLTKQIRGVDTLIYKYIIDKDFLDADDFKYSQMTTYGALGIVNKNLLNENYEFDNSGKIIQKTIYHSNSSTKYTFSYDCE